MIRRTTLTISTVFAFAALGCGGSRPPATAAVAAPDPTPADSLGDLARADSIARSDSLARLARSRADRVREEIADDRGNDPGDGGTRTGLAPADSVVLYQLIHFEFDSDRIEPAYEVALERKLAIMRANPLLEVRIGGHADDRGADEYNLALGLRRASAVHRWLVAHGIPEARITLVSYGEERPLDPGGTESAWSANRRADFTVTRPARELP